MVTSELVSNVYLVAAGKLPTFASGSTKWAKIVAIANNKIDAWQREPGVDWNSLYDPSYSFGKITATDTFSLDDEIRKLSDTEGDDVTINRLDGQQTTYKIVPADQLKQYQYGNFCAQIGRNLVFSKPFTTADIEFGGTLLVPIYTYAPHLVGDNDEVPVDDPQWLVLMVSAEYVRNDIVKQNQYPNLINEANGLMTSMKETNDSQWEEVIRPWHAPGANW